MKIRHILALVTMFALMTSAQTYYLGTGDASSVGMSACAACHKQGGSAPANYEQWKLSGHAVAQDSFVNYAGYGFNCLRCHNTGWDTTKVNYGADEYVTKTTGTPNYTVTDAAKWAKVKNVGCESCHGPMGTSSGMLDASHWGFGTTNKLDLSAENCGKCHQGSHHPYYDEWLTSGHAKSLQHGAVVNNNKRCVKCHVAQNFVAYISNPSTYKDSLLVTGADQLPITCVVCHDPHGNGNPGQLRVATTAASTICDKCHTSGIDSVNVNTTPHHATSECLTGGNKFGYRYAGSTYQNSMHTYAATERCVNCHVYPTAWASASAPGTSAHNFQPRVQACATCHADYYTAVDTSNHDTRFNYRNSQHIMDSLITKLQSKLNAANTADSATVAFKRANYNLNSVLVEGSRGIHNYKLSKQLLVDAIANFTPSDVKKEEGTPNSFELSQNYPNPFNPSTEIKFSIPKAGNVSVVVYDINGRQVVTLAEGFMNAGKYSVRFNGTNVASGVYFYQIRFDNQTITKKMALLK